MRFQKKIMVLYVVFGLLTAILLGGGYYKISIQQDLQNEYQNLNRLADQYEEQWDEYIKPMKSIMSYILSNQELLESLRMLGTINKNSQYYQQERTRAQEIISTTISTDYINKTFYRVVLFNQLGDVTSSNDYSDTIVDKNKNVNSISWMNQVENTKGKNIFLGKHLDDWGKKQQPEVFSVVKEVQGTNMGYIEVQRKVADLSSVFQVTDNTIRLLLIDSSGGILYTNGSEENMDFYCAYVQNEEPELAEVYNSSTEMQEVIACRTSEESDVKILVSCNLQDIAGKSFYIIPITILLAGGFFGISFIYTWMSSRLLTKPIRELREFMDNTKFEEGKEAIEFATTNDEIELLNQSYKDVLERLDTSVRREKRMAFLQLQAQNDLLQAQINPHFIYNVLNVISARGIEDEDDEICEICGCLAQMLRYSTNTKKRYATVKEEVEYVEQYFRLMQGRYEYRLQYEIKVNSDIEDQILPKIVLQQLVENSLTHGFQNVEKNMQVTVQGGVKNNGWYLEVRDNGTGFSPEIIKMLQEDFKNMRKKMLEERENIEMEIGGMGLVNTYARLYLIYGDRLKFTVDNHAEGASVIIFAPVKEDH